MNIDNIRAFLEVSETGSFQQAAENLHITQSAMSSRIKGLEERLKRQLFIRNRNGAILTTGGKIFKPHAIAVLTAWRRAKQELALDDRYQQSIRLGIQLNHWYDVAEQWKSWMQANAQNYAPLLCTDSSTALTQQVFNGSVDLAMVYDPLTRTDITVEKYQAYNLVMVSTEPLDMSKDTILNYLYVDFGMAFRHKHNHLYANSVNVSIEFSSASLALEHLKANNGTAYLLESMVEKLIDEQKLFIVKQAKVIVLQSYLIYSAERKNNEDINSAKQALTQIIS